jgi:signal transduction histidine kinase
VTTLGGGGASGGRGATSWLARPSRWRLTTRIAVVALTLLALLLIIAAVSYTQLVRERRGAAVDDAVLVAQMAGAVVDGFARDVEGTTLAAALAPGLRDGPLDQAAAGPYLDALAPEYGPILRALFLTDTDGRVVAAQRGEAVGTDVSTRPYVQALRAGAETVWTPGGGDSQRGAVTVAFARVVRAPGGSPRAYLVAAYDPAALIDRLPGGVPPDADVTVLDSRGFVLHSTQHPDLPLDRRDATGLPLVRAALGGEVVRLVGPAPVDGGEPRFGALVPVPRTGWVVVLTRPLAPLEAVPRRRFLEEAGGIALVVLLAAALLVALVRRLIGPVGLLAGTAAAIARGERPAVPDVAGGPEVAPLAASMRAMGAAVAAREDALTRALAETQDGNEQLRRQSVHLAILAEASRAFTAARFDAQALYDTVSRCVADAIGDGCSLSLVAEDGRLLNTVAVYHPHPEALALAWDLVRASPVRTAEGLAAQLVQAGQPVLVPGISPELLREAVAPEQRAYLERFGPHSVASAPLRIQDRLIGALGVWREPPGSPYTQDDLVLLQDLADGAVLALDNVRLYEERDRALAAAQEAIRTRDEFLASASHDLKNPLTTIKGTAQALRRRAEREGALDPARVAAALEGLDSAATKMAAQIDALLDVARLQMGRPLELARRPTDLVALARRSAAEYQQTTESHRIGVEASETELVGAWDPTRLERVLGNLLDNAIKYSQKGGDITVHLAREGAGAGAWVVLTVRDRGMGIPAADVPRIFERFRRGANVVGRIGGAGIGLAGVRQIVEQHDGTIAVESQEGRGSTFTVRLPLAAPAAGAD